MSLLPVTLTMSALALLAGAIGCAASRATRKISLSIPPLMLLPGVSMWWLVEDERDFLLMLVASPIWLLVVGTGWAIGATASSGGIARRRYLWVIPPLIAINGVLAGAQAYMGFLERSARGAEAARELQKRETLAQQCIRDISGRSAEGDAAADVKRGDATPIGLTYMPHDPPTETTFYPGACEEIRPWGVYRSTGKWFKRTYSGFSFMEPPSAGKCDRLREAYVHRYNLEMLRLARPAVRRFCLREGGRLSDD
ncbi:hypothetical protein [Sphingosinicella sp. LY1275]|uniref:hypothetical protein n=1 Tax=Sphingosinicella sp. LY1275 TaxID=3095379 RepID=UPI002ADEA5C7|nr:hypothetical protein [Sphingosinicella sp. LY1275]MEA1015855.1 hypothetical protein [Sphingosinicella sp. LY1275]